MPVEKVIILPLQSILKWRVVTNEFFGPQAQRMIAPFSKLTEANCAPTTIKIGRSFLRTYLCSVCI